jgi:hypothetical protein
MSNMPKLSNRASQALDVLADGGRFTIRLERNSYTRREQFQTRLLDSRRNVVPGIGAAAYRELDKACMLVWSDSTSVSTEYVLRNERSEKISALTRMARGPADGWEYAGWEANAERARQELAEMQKAS